MKMGLHGLIEWLVYGLIIAAFIGVGWRIFKDIRSGKIKGSWRKKTRKGRKKGILADVVDGFRDFRESQRPDELTKFFNHGDPGGLGGPWREDRGGRR